MVELALKMDIDGDKNIMQTENAYFDATHSRVHGFKSFGLWVYHPSMQRILCLASMDICSKNSKDIAKVSKTEGNMFNPKTFMCNEGGANHKAKTLCKDTDTETADLPSLTTTPYHPTSYYPATWKKWCWNA